MRSAYRLRVGRVTSAEPVMIELDQLGRLYQTAQHSLFLSDTECQATSSCVWNGGTSRVHGWLNLKVCGNAHIFESPADTLQHYAQQLDIHAPLAGMMTAASMNSLRYSTRGNHATRIACMVTAGIQNARRSGDQADEQPQPGTINIALVCNHAFSPAACIEALMIATEAKTAACYDLNIISPVSNNIATGTGTDSICLLNAVNTNINADNNSVIDYCGKHTLMGEWIGAAAYEAILDSLRACVELQR